MTFQFRLEGTAGAADNNTGEESSTGSGRRQFFVVRGGGCTGAVAHDGDTDRVAAIAHKVGAFIAFGTDDSSTTCAGRSPWILACRFCKTRGHDT